MKITLLHKSQKF